MILLIILTLLNMIQHKKLHIIKIPITVILNITPGFHKNSFKDQKVTRLAMYSMSTMQFSYYRNCIKHICSYFYGRLSTAVFTVMLWDMLLLRQQHLAQ